jgi:uncharacterized membrane protein YkvA (DUF1232 family)
MMLRKSRLLRAANTARLATYLIALWKLFKHPQAPRGAKLVAVAVIAYAVSPIDLIPDFIPVLGFADDAIAIVIALRYAIRHAGQDAITRNWPGTTQGLQSLLALTTSGGVRAE